MKAEAVFIQQAEYGAFTIDGRQLDTRTSMLRRPIRKLILPSCEYVFRRYQDEP